MTAARTIRPLAAVHLREAMTATANHDGPAALAALMHIDAESWQAINARLAQLGTDILTVLNTTAVGGIQ
ncbi:hypothetical protein AB0D08_32735 [Kitasatospora sp. NPDC048540]|uniref:hypothetical protein n=1 Tax=Kitasatospora sp. NPDC048540 TaxID=3155634 RepID=UPI00340E7ECB